MMRRLPVPIGVLVLVLASLACAQTATTQQDTWAGVERIVAVGDVHGDYNQFVKVLLAAKVINEKNDWIAGKTHLVQTGDVLDRGPDSRKAMDLLMALEEQALKAGGAVHCLIGNHEAMVPMDDWRYVHRGEKLAFGDAAGEGLRKAMSAEGKYGRWIRSHNAVIKINDVLFVHAGLAAKYADKTLAEINEQVRKDIDKGNMDGVAMDSDGPLWNRSLAGGGADAVVELDTGLKKFGATRMV
ncbi:MAG: metallophosphoesterase, partial [Phycisphaerae bacterium]|nr:metallophosphoesterase [Phycisphaerae bacterium]